MNLIGNSDKRKMEFIIVYGYYVAYLVMPYGLVESSQPLDIEGSLA